MALARIVSRSHQCSRELALHLLARGYAVEIVSPNSIPDNIADLELRVDAGSGDQLIASVEAHDGERSASLEFVHHLKAPMVDFIRRPPEPGDAVHFPEQPVRFNAEPSIEDEELPAEVPHLAAKTVSPAAEILLDPGFDPKEGARLILPLEQSPSLPVEPPGHFSAVAATIPQPTVLPTMVQPSREPQRRDRPAEWFGRAALTLASGGLLALVLGFGMRPTGKSSGQRSGAVPAEKAAAASTDMDLLNAVGPEKDPGQVSAVAVLPPAIKSDGSSDHAPKESQVKTTGASTARATTAGSGARISRRTGDDLIARDTVTYFDRRTSDEAAARATSSKRFARLHPSSRQHDGGVIAANTVTYLNNKPTPKAAEQNGIKHPSDPN
jgi:hypothetical protein